MIEVLFKVYCLVLVLNYIFIVEFPPPTHTHSQTPKNTFPDWLQLTSMKADTLSSKPSAISKETTAITKETTSNMVVWMRLVPVCSYIWILGSQLMELFSIAVMEEACHSEVGFVISKPYTIPSQFLLCLCLWIRCKFSATAPEPCVPF